jgi:hypothetical protein
MTRLGFASAVVALTLLSTADGQDRTAAGASGKPQIRVQQAPAGGAARFEVVGLDRATLAELAKSSRTPDEWADLFAVHVTRDGQAVPTGQPPVLGTYRVSEGVLRFEPRFPLQPGVRYRAVLHVAKLPKAGAGAAVTLEHFIPKPAARATTVVEQVYPTSDQLPENQLKFYLYFSAPMARGEAYRRVHLLDAAGKAVEFPFLELDEELWNPEGKRFTLFFDPGRIKRGLKPREEVGPSLEEGKSYTLVIDREWNDTAGNPLKESFRKSYRVGPPDDEQLDARTWKLQAPAAGSSAPLTVTFPKPLDRGLLERIVWVTDRQGRRVEGKVAISKQETCWQLTPEKPWAAGSYHLVAETTLEDRAGNNLARPF